MKVPGSPSSPLTASSRGAGSWRTSRHLRPVGNPAPPSPRSPESLERLDQLLGLALAGEAGLQQAVAAIGAVGVEADIGRDVRVGLAGRDRGGDAGDGRVLVQRVADRDDRRAVAAAHARRAHDPHPVAEPAAAASASSRSAPTSSQLRLSHTRTVSGGGACSSSMTMSKWA